MSSFVSRYFSIPDDRPLIGLAPMPSYADVPQRRVCQQMGADFTVAVYDTTLSDIDAPVFVASDREQGAHVVQLIGSDPVVMAEKARYVAECGATIVDINLGRPGPNGDTCGAALLTDIESVRELLQAVVAACPVPVSVKTRLGVDADTITVFDVARIADDLGICMLTIHGRTKAEGFTGAAQFDTVAEVKAAFPHMTIIANGDINSPERAKEVIEQTSCDGVMIGRAAIGEPWLFCALRAKLDYNYVVPDIDIAEVITNHIGDIHSYYGEEQGRALAKKYIGHYLMHFGQEHQLMVFTDEDSCRDQMQKLAIMFPTSVDGDVDNHVTLDKAPVYQRTKAELREALAIHYDEYHNISAKYSGAKLERRLEETLAAIAQCKAELRAQSLLGRLWARLRRH